MTALIAWRIWRFAALRAMIPGAYRGWAEIVEAPPGLHTTNEVGVNGHKPDVCLTKYPDGATRSVATGQDANRGGC